MGSENPSGADNQQETASPCLVLDPNWIAGFVDGEGCFSVSVHRSSMMRRHGGGNSCPFSTSISTRTIERFSKLWSRPSAAGEFARKGPRSSVLTYAVEALQDLEVAIVPFFEHHPLVVKRDNFSIFAAIVR
jgi:LAGLIDADG endonuclease